MSDPDVIRRSVTRDDYTDNPYTGSIGMYFVYPTPYSGPSYAPLPKWWSMQRDFVLRGTVHRESMWAAAVTKAITKTAALGWERITTAARGCPRLPAAPTNSSERSAGGRD